MKFLCKNVLNTFVSIIFIGGCYFWAMVIFYVVGGCK